ncbi:unnamed protein product, partial [Brassica oleracea]
FSVHRIHYNIEDLPCIKEIGKLHRQLVVWNPSLAQTRWIELRNKRSVYKRRGLGRCAIGYDNNKNHKVLVRFYDVYDNNITNVKHEIYDFKSSSWRGHDIINPKRIRERVSLFVSCIISFYSLMNYIVLRKPGQLLLSS